MGGEKSHASGDKALEKGVREFLASRNRHTLDPGLVTKIGNFILTLTSVKPTIPFKGKTNRNLSEKQRELFKAKKYCVRDKDDEFLGHWLDPSSVYFLFSRKTYTPSRSVKYEESEYIHEFLATLCMKRPNILVPNHRFKEAVPRFVKDMRHSQKLMCVDKDYVFHTANKPADDPVSKTAQLHWFPSIYANRFLSILGNDDVYVRRTSFSTTLYTRWFAIHLTAK